MALGVVPLVVNYAGPGELVTEDTGFKIPCGSRQEISAGFKEKLGELAEDPGQLQPMAANAKARVRSHFLWSRKAAQVDQVYQWAVSRTRSEKPDHFKANSGQSFTETAQST